MSRCWTCNVTLEDSNAFRSHYNSEFHLTNVRRRVEGLGPLSLHEHKQTHFDAAGGGAMDGGSGGPFYSCTLCKKIFHTVQTLQTHIRSTAHLVQKEQRIIERDSEAASMLSMTSLGSTAMGLHRRHKAKHAVIKAQNGEHGKKVAPKVTPEDRLKDASENRCLFCGYFSPNISGNVVHMKQVHTFFIPMEAYCKNVSQLLAYLARKVNGLVCLVCNEKTRSFGSLDALRNHMHEAQHQRIILSPEYQDFYNCTLEDPNSRVAPSVLSNVCNDELVLVGGKGARGTTTDSKVRILRKRETEVPRPRPREAPDVMEKRKAILSAEQAMLAVAKREQMELTAAHRKEEGQILKQCNGNYQKHQLKVCMHSNKLHPKGYDGSGLLN